MDIRARRAALRAAFNIAFAGSLLGCVGEVAVPPSDEPSPEDQPSTPPTETPTDTAPETPADPVAEPPAEEVPLECDEPASGWGIYQKDTFDCCVGLTEEALEEHGSFLAGTLGERADEVQGCCTQLTAPNQEALWSGQPLPYPAPAEVLASCCELVTGTPSCTPWGPPAPPAMPADDDLAWLDAAMRGAA